ncbi:hypothetical protein F2Q68_00003808 [Brassica cretica]|uniref:Uncharacterized protein n=1 Tax=Brassica cretica TaxID=69181 RepID=A0A8S9JAG9_BRACR|nr:hypothetical protein F2Q68_00003808 [Brassica cretica]
MGGYRLLRSSGVVIGIILLHFFVFSSLVSSDELLFVVGETGAIQVSPSLEVKGSPGLKPERTSLCERIHINGLRRFKHLDKYAHSLKLILNASTAGKASNFDVCFHRSDFLLLGICRVQLGCALQVGGRKSLRVHGFRQCRPLTTKSLT